MTRFATAVGGVLLVVAALGGILPVVAIGAAGEGAAKAPEAAAPGAPPAEASPPAPLLKVPDPRAAENPAYPLVPMAMPEAGKPFTDPRFGTHLVRATESRGLRHEYSRHDPFNTGCSLVLLHRVDSGAWEVYRTASLPYDRKENLVRTVDLEEARWDPAEGDLLWGTREFRIETLNVRTGEVRIVKDFTKDLRVAPLLKAEKDLYRVTMKDEGETSLDKRYWALAIQGSADDYRLRHLVVWDRREDKVLGLRSLAREESDVDWVGMSPRGTWVLLGGMAENRAPLAGLVIADKALGEFHRIDQTTAHADVGLDAAGREVVVMQNTRTDHIDLIPLDPKTAPMLEGGAYDGTGRTPLVRLAYDSESPAGFASGVHISCNAPGWAVVSTYMEPGRKEQNWLDRSIVVVRLDQRRPEAFYLAKVYSTCGAYWEETQATISADGSRVVWAADWDRDVGKERPVLMQLGMPAGWKGLLK